MCLGGVSPHGGVAKKAWARARARTCVIAAAAEKNRIN